MTRGGKNWGTAGSESLHMSTWLCRWQTLRDETKVWALSCGHHVFLTGACSPLHGSHWWFSSSPWTSRRRGVLGSASVLMGNMFLSHSPLHVSGIWREASYLLHPRSTSSASPELAYTPDIIRYTAAHCLRENCLLKTTSKMAPWHPCMHL